MINKQAGNLCHVACDLVLVHFRCCIRISHLLRLHRRLITLAAAINKAGKYKQHYSHCEASAVSACCKIQIRSHRADLLLCGLDLKKKKKKQQKRQTEKGVSDAPKGQGVCSFARSLAHS